MDSRIDLVDYLRDIAGLFPNQRTIEAVVYERGREFAAPAKPRPVGIRKGANHQCYRNAYSILFTQPGLRYVEGFAADGRFGFPMQHAWVIDEKDNVIETTWMESGLAYYGIVLEIQFINEVLFEKRTYGVLDFASKIFRERYALAPRKIFPDSEVFSCQRT